MNSTLPYLFFFSYSRGDWKSDPYLERFFVDLVKRVGMASGVDGPGIAFRDEEGVKSGEDWTLKISGALQRSDVLVCIYSPYFFSKARTHEFCAKEFTAFLKRDPNHRYERVLEEGGVERYEVRDPRNILPILWLSEKELVELNRLPPYSVRTLQYTLSSAPRELRDRYIDKGMSLLARNRKLSSYWEIVANLASRIKEMSDKRLPSIEPPPDARTLRNAFWDLPETASAEGALPPQDGGGAESLKDAGRPSPGPRELMAFEVRARASDTRAWAPFPAEPSMSVLVEEIAQSRQRISRYQIFDPSAADFGERLLAALKDATEKRALPILFVAPEALARREWRAKIMSLLHEQWRGGIVFPLDASDRTSLRFIENDFELTPNEREWIVIRVANEGVAELRTAAISVADDILARIVKYGSVERRTPATVGPDVRPRITNT